MSRLMAWAKVVFATVLLLASSVSFAQQGAEVVEEKPSALAMTADLLLVRPVMLVATVVGSAVWLVSSPFSLAGGNAGEAAETLVLEPAKTTFVRCLGCTKNGYKKDVQ